MKSIFQLIILSSFIYISNSQVKLIHPNGGEVLWSGGRTEILYEGAPDTNFVELMVTYDNGRNWDNITHDIYNSKWYIPQVQSDSCKLALNYFEDRGIINSATFGGSGGEGNSFILPAADSGYYLIGNSSSTDIETINKVDNIYMYKLNSGLEVEWIKAYGGSEYDRVTSVIQSKNNKIVLVGDSKSSDGDIEKNIEYHDIFLMQINSKGEVEWSKSYGGSGGDYSSTGSQTNDGGFVITGTTNSNDITEEPHLGNDDIFVLKVDSLGEQKWVKKFGTLKTDRGTFITQAENGDYLLGAYSEGSFDSINNFGMNDAWIFRLDSLGEILWTRNYGGKSHDIFKSIISDSNGGFIIVGNSNSDVSDQYIKRHGSSIWVLNIDSAGEVNWSKTFGGSQEDYGVSIINTNNNDFLIVGFITTADGNIRYNIRDGDYYVMCIDSKGALKWVKAFGGTNIDEPTSICKSEDGSFVLSGVTLSNDVDLTSDVDGITDFWVVKFDGESNIIQTDTSDAYFTIVDPTQTNTEVGKTDESTVSPNPTNGIVNINVDCNSNFMSYSVTNLEGVEIINRQNIDNKNSIKLNLADYPSGIYFVTTVCGSENNTYKIIKQN